MNDFNSLLDDLVNGYYSEGCHQFGHFGIKIMYPNLGYKYFPNAPDIIDHLGITIQRNFEHHNYYAIGLIVKQHNNYVVIHHAASMACYSYEDIVRFIEIICNTDLKVEHLA